MRLFPTPSASDGDGSRSPAPGRTSKVQIGLPNAVKELAERRLLPTPTARDHGDGGRDLRTTVVRDWDTEAWAEYLPAILGWCKRTHSTPPVPVELNSNGNLRIAARFSEWMMGWPSGWVTSFITTNRKLYKEGMVSRTAAMRMIGNGVVPQQAIMAIDALMEEW